MRKDNRIGATAQYLQAFWAADLRNIPLAETTEADYAAITTWLFETDNLNDCTGVLFH